MLLLVVANGRWIFPPATWIAPIAWLVFLERSRALTGLLIGGIAYVGVQFVAWDGLIPAPGILFFLIAGAYGLIYFLPFAAHRLLARRLAGFAQTLVFPLAWVTTELVLQRWITPYGSWFSLPYTQANSLVLAQLASVAGTWGISFLMTWVAAVVVWSFTDRQTTAERRGGLALATAAVIGVLLFGYARLAVPPAEDQVTVRLAGLVPSAPLMDELESAFDPVRRGEAIDAPSLAHLEAAAARLNNDLFARSRREARAGADIVAWSETAGRVTKRHEELMLDRAAQLATKEKIVFLIAYGVWDPDGDPPLENKVAAIPPTGDVAWEYRKAHPIVGAESPLMSPGDGVVRTLDTATGRIAAVICHDLDFPTLLAQANRNDVGLVVGPSADWAAITPLHADMAIFRAIENGFSLFRPTSNGRSIATDPWGRTVSIVDYPDDAMVAHLQVARVPTVYGSIGDAFAWLCLVGFVALAVIGVARDRGSRGEA